jgi:hypothetical protein
MDYAAAVQRGGPGFAIDEMARLLLHKSVPAFPPSAGVAISRGGTGGPFAAIGVWGIGLRHGQWLTGNTDDEVGMRAVRILLKIVVAVIVVAALGGGSLFFYKTQAAVTPVACFRNQSVKRGNLVSTISATGTLEAEEVVNVGSLVSGKRRSITKASLRKATFWPRLIQPSTKCRWTNRKRRSHSPKPT